MAAAAVGRAGEPGEIMHEGGGEGGGEGGWGRRVVCSCARLAGAVEAAG